MRPVSEIDRRSLLGTSLGLTAAAMFGSVGSAAQSARPSGQAPSGQAPSELPFGSDGPNIRPGDRPFGASCSSRSPVYGRHGAAASAHPIATQVGIAILREGGSAVDAAIAINICLGLLEPASCGIGGDCYAMLWDPRAEKVVGLAGSGRSPRSLDLATARSRAIGGVLPRYGAVTASVPGAVDGWWLLHQRYGKLPWKALFEPAIALATEGTVVPDVIAGFISFHMSDLRRNRAQIEEFENAEKLFAPSGRLPNVGDIRRNPDLARTYRLIADGGRDAFYRGEIADRMDRYFRRIGGWLRKEDLASHRGDWTTPLSTTYRDAEVFALGENTQGISTLQILNILEGFDLQSAAFQSGLSLHLQAEAKRLAFEDRARHYGDPKAVDVPVGWLISKEYGAQRAKLIKKDRLIDQIFPGQAPAHGDTTYLTVADDDGMMVSLIQSNYFGLGNGLVPDGLGFMIQNRGQLFNLNDRHPNIYAPGKRPFQTIIPGFALKEGRPLLSFGVMGGEIQPQAQAQVIINREDYSLDVQASGDSPRWYHSGSSEDMGEDAPGVGPRGQLRLESAVPTEAKSFLSNIGWDLVEPRTGFFGRYHGIETRGAQSERVYAAGSDMRADGCALAY
ncbi:gamma-glutamyltransferase family protein [Sphingobium sp. CECT 9361]|uniref:gamma-glutamyltransferase family protein n=1 Tax=Sphingobium sp. CECT 9361 TaxID=2845384 RepID=UPI001E4634FD|nr:gamma-glutamyltransferase family protein [Sphingobium sp. CECT 9361]CAH0355637.1 hypothetical protein SPH9361_03662 [Sphingobium sp. CECT 9361]